MDIVAVEPGPEAGHELVVGHLRQSAELTDANVRRGARRPDESDLVACLALGVSNVEHDHVHRHQPDYWQRAIRRHSPSPIAERAWISVRVAHWDGRNPSSRRCFISRVVADCITRLYPARLDDSRTNVHDRLGIERRPRATPHTVQVDARPNRVPFRATMPDDCCARVGMQAGRPRRQSGYRIAKTLLLLRHGAVIELR